MTDNKIVQIIYTLIDKVSGGAKKIESSLKDVDTAGKKSGESLGKLNKTQEKSSPLSLTAAGAYAAVATAIFAVGRASLQASITYEQQMVSFEAMLGSAVRANEIMKDITETAQTTPFQKTELIEYAKQLYAIGVAEEDLISTMRMLGDVAAGVGKEKLPLIVYAYGQVMSAGRLTNEEIRQFANSSVPLLATLAKMFGTTTAGIRKMAEEGKISSEDARRAFEIMTSEGGKYYKQQEKLAKTTGGAISNFVDKLGEAAIGLGNLLKPALDKLIEWGTKILGLGPVLAPIGKLLGIILIPAFKIFVFLMERLGETTGAFLKIFSYFSQGILNAGSAIKYNFLPALDSVLRLLDKIGGAFKALPTLISNAFSKNKQKVNMTLGYDGSTIKKYMDEMNAARKKEQELQIAEKKKAAELRKKEQDEIRETRRIMAEEKRKADEEAAAKEAEKLQKKREQERRNREQEAKDRYEAQMAIDEPLLKLYYENEEKKYRAKLETDQLLKDKEAEKNKYFIDAFEQLGQGQINLQEAISKGLLQWYIKEKLAELDVLAAGMFQSGTARLMGSMFTNPLGYAEIAASAALVAGSRAALSQIKLAEGGVVMPQAGGIQATIGEGGKPEAVIPLDDKRSQDLLGTGNSTRVIILDADGMTTLAKGVYKKQTELLKTGELSPRK